MLKNVTELLVQQKLETLMKAQACCQCEECKESIMAYALNRLAPHYVSSDAGELYTRVKLLAKDCDFDVLRQLALAMKVVVEHPHHTTAESDKE